MVLKTSDLVIFYVKYIASWAYNMLLSEYWKEFTSQLLM